MLLPLLGAAVVLSGCDQLAGMGAARVEARATEDDIEAFLTYQDALVGKSTEEVRKVFGKPKGMFERRSGMTWMYSRWVVEFDSEGTVLGLERDIAATRSGDGSAVKSMALAATPVAALAGGGPAKSIVKVSNGGQRVDLNSLMPSGKVVIVDFYADWCGPCRNIAPHLEQMANANPDVVLVKIDIVKWGTPVTQQYQINSVPNVRVFDRNGRQVGSSTSSLSKIQSFVKQAGG